MSALRSGVPVRFRVSWLHAASLAWLNDEGENAAAAAQLMPFGRKLVFPRKLAAEILESLSLFASEQTDGQTNKNPPRLLPEESADAVAQVFEVNKKLKRSIRLSVWPRRRSEVKRGGVPADAMWSFAGGFVLLRSQSVVTHPHSGGGGVSGHCSGVWQRQR